MGPKMGTASKRGKGRAPPPPSQKEAGFLVQDLLSDEDYDRYIKKFQSQKGVSTQFYCSLWDIESMGLRFHEFLGFQNLGTFVELKDDYDESQINAFYCNAQRLDGVSLNVLSKMYGHHLIRKIGLL